MGQVAVYGRVQQPDCRASVCRSVDDSAPQYRSEMLYESGALTIESFRPYTASKGLRVWSLGLPGPPCRLICGCDSSFQLAAICLPLSYCTGNLVTQTPGKDMLTASNSSFPIRRSSPCMTRKTLLKVFTPQEAGLHNFKYSGAGFCNPRQHRI